MGSSDSEKDCNLKHRTIPKLTPEKATTDKDAKKDDKEREETPEERIKRISEVKITFSDFFAKCVDHDMLKLFFGSLIAFFFFVGMITCLYLVVCYFFRQQMWHFYFPQQTEHHHSAHEFLDQSNINNNSSMSNGTINQSMGNIPKRIPHDSAQWFKELEEQVSVIGPHEMERYLDENEFYFYLVISVLTLAFMVAILVIYCFCCVWALKGNLDLPRPGEDPTSRVQVYIRNPFPSFLMFFGSKPQDAAGRPKASTSPPTTATTDGSQHGAEDCQHAVGSSNNRRNSSISRAVVVSRSKSFENRAMDICDSYKQFQQFRYDIHDDEPEDVVFDLYDLQK